MHIPELKYLFISNALMNFPFNSQNPQQFRFKTTWYYHSKLIFFWYIISQQIS